MESFRHLYLSRSILRAVFSSGGGSNENDDPWKNQTYQTWFLGLFSLFDLPLARWKAPLFKELRSRVWDIEEGEYKESFRDATRDGKDRHSTGGILVAVGDLGYSGSTFFTTPDSKFLIKSLPRRFEYDFFKYELLAPYASHMHSHPNSLLVRITDFLYTPSWPLGRVLGTAPSHHIIMENILYGKESSSNPKKWETYDLKPSSYFFPERDIAGGNLAPQSVKDRLIDEFPDKVRVTARQRSHLLEILERDTELLKQANVVDYSLFLVRFSAADDQRVPSVGGNIGSNSSPSSSSPTADWRSGVRSSDGKWIYRIALLDFFWAKHALQAKTFEGLVKGYNLLDKKGPMSITTTAEEYQGRFLGMVKEMVMVEDGTQETRGS